MAVGHDPAALPESFLASLDQRVLATLSTVRPDGSPHVVAVGFTWDAEGGLAQVVTRANSVKARNIAATGRAALCQFDGRGNWFTLEGPAEVVTDEAVHAAAKQAYLVRYGGPDLPTDAVVRLRPERAMGMWR